MLAVPPAAPCWGAAKHTQWAAECALQQLQVLLLTVPRSGEHMYDPRVHTSGAKVYPITRKGGFLPSDSENGMCSEGACSASRSSPPGAALHGLTPGHG